MLHVPCQLLYWYHRIPNHEKSLWIHVTFLYLQLFIISIVLWPFRSLSKNWGQTIKINVTFKEKNVLKTYLEFSVSVDRPKNVHLILKLLDGNFSKKYE